MNLYHIFLNSCIYFIFLGKIQMPPEDSNQKPKHFWVNKFLSMMWVALGKVECSGKRLMVCWKIWGFWNSFSYKIVFYAIMNLNNFFEDIWSYKIIFSDMI
jgi:hypothetical protein